MRSIRSIFLLLAIISLSIIAIECTKASSPCKTREACLNNPDCHCWCSQICGWRKKTASDHPVYIENDPYGKHCYCKLWDYEHYEDNCINRKNIKEPEGAQ